MTDSTTTFTLDTVWRVLTIAARAAADTSGTTFSAEYARLGALRDRVRAAAALLPPRVFARTVSDALAHHAGRDLRAAHSATIDTLRHGTTAAHADALAAEEARLEARLAARADAWPIPVALRHYIDHAVTDYADVLANEARREAWHASMARTRTVRVTRTVDADIRGAAREPITRHHAVRTVRGDEALAITGLRRGVCQIVGPALVW